MLTTAAVVLLLSIFCNFILAANELFTTTQNLRKNILSVLNVKKNTFNQFYNTLQHTLWKWTTLDDEQNNTIGFENLKIKPKRCEHGQSWFSNTHIIFFHEISDQYYSSEKWVCLVDR